DRERRPAFACGVGDGYGSVIWIQWEPKILGHTGTEPLAVYVQSHVLRRMLERLSSAKDRNFVHRLLIYSLAQPKVIRREAEDYWVECRDVEGNRLGYLIASINDGKVIIRTFL